MKNITCKIILTTSLLMSGMASGQNFYTCVPKEDYIKNLAKQTNRTDEEIKRLAKQAVPDYHIQNEARKVRRTDDEIKNLIKSNAVSIECKTYNFTKDKETLQNIVGFYIIRYKYELFLCQNLWFFEDGFGEFAYCNYNFTDYYRDAKLVCYDKYEGYKCKDQLVEVCKFKGGIKRAFDYYIWGNRYPTRL